MGSEAKKIKREFVLKSSWDREGIESFLEKKAAGGWMLESINDIIWQFRKEEPQNLHFPWYTFRRRPPMIRSLPRNC